jgi:hypothetical protein
MSKVNFLSPVGRLVQGSPYKASTKDADGNPLVFKTGANAGQARSNYFMGIAIPKGSEQHWNQTDWGKLIWSVGAAAFPAAHKSAAFAWKIEDGDSTTPNSRGKRPCDTEGFAGNWIIRFSASFAPKVYREDNGAYVQVLEQDFILPGYYIQVSGTVDGNGSQQRPGIYLNQSMVAFSSYGPVIHFGPDANSVGFGKAPLPAGASATPLAPSVPLPAAVPTAVASVTPNPAFLNVPAPPTAEPKMTAKAGGSSYQAFKTAGWTDESLVAQGYITI